MIRFIILLDKARIEKLKEELQKLIDEQEAKDKELSLRQSKDVQTVYSSAEWESLQRGRIEVVLGFCSRSFL
jgi:hypothetical protein